MSEEKTKRVRIEFFESPTCPHCAVAQGMLKAAEKIYKDDIEIVNINVTTKNGAILAQLNNITGTPTIFINGELKFQGEPQRESLLFEAIENFLDEKALKRAKTNKQRITQRRNMIYS